MGKAGRIACITIPMVLTITSLALLVLVFLGNREVKNDTTLQFYFWRADATNFTNNPNFDAIQGTNVDNVLASALIGQLQAGNLSDIYQVGLWDHCEGDRKTNSTSSPINFTLCTKPETFYFFNLTEVWNLQGTNGTASDQLPKTLRDAEKVYKVVAKWMFVAYAVALCATALEVVVGIFAIFSRWGSCVTSLVSSASTFFTLAAAITSTALTSIIVGALNASLRPFGIKTSFGVRMLAVVWLAVVFSMAASTFWTFTTCCCSGSSGTKRDGGIRRQGTLVEQGRYTHEYKPIDEPFGSAAYPQRSSQRDSFTGGQRGVPMQNFADHGYGGHDQQQAYGGGAHEPAWGGHEQQQQQQQYGVHQQNNATYEPFRTV